MEEDDFYDRVNDYGDGKENGECHDCQGDWSDKYTDYILPCKICGGYRETA